MEYIESQLEAVRDAMWNFDGTRLYDTITALLENPDFCPEGGLLGFTLNNEYQVSPGQDLNDVFVSLEGEDNAIRVVFDYLGLKTSVNTVLRDCRSSDIWHSSWSGGLGLLDCAVEVSDPLDLDTSLLKCSQYGELSKSIAWVRPLKDGRTGYELDGVSYKGFARRSGEFSGILMDVIRSSAQHP
ncbi:hypothetical protein L218DRAFT_951036 [Marasmius fiardii PR-910]|nr:hypothetical protein L218DRAFT_951036 [Marasmius fiardii PR-910]